MPRQRNFDSLYKSLNIKQIKETPTIPESERPSHNLSQSHNSISDFLFEDYKDGKGLLTWKRKVYRLDDEQLQQLRQMLMKDLEGKL